MTEQFRLGGPATEPALNGQGPPSPAPVQDPSRRVCAAALGEGSLTTVLAVREVEVRQKRNGEAFLQLSLGDSSGRIRALSWDDVDLRRELCSPGAVVWVRGEFKDDSRYGPTLTVRELRLAEEGEYEIGELAGSSEIPLERLEADLRSLIATIQDRDLQRLLEALLGEGSQTWPRYRDAPAAKYYHQAFAHGLLDHSLSVAQAVSASAAAFPGIDRDVAVTGALLHDIGKTLAYNDDPLAIDLTDAGRLQGEIPLGYYIVRSAIEAIEEFDPDTAQAILHIVLSHHGTLENGSPVVPCTREATLVHAMDNLGGKLGSFDRIERELAEGESWSRFDRGIAASAYFSSRAA